MTVEGLRVALREIDPRARLLHQAFKQNLSLVHEPGRAVAALKGKVFDERFLQRGKLAILGMAFHRSDRLAVEVYCRNDAGRAGVARPVGIIDDDRATQTLRDA